MISLPRGVRAPRDAGEVLSIAERSRYLAAVRVGLVVAVAVLGMVDRAALPSSSINLLLAAGGAYLALITGAALLARRSDAMQLPLAAGSLMLDGIFLGSCVAISGGATSPLRFLAVAHVVAVTLLFSYRSGLKMAIWHSTLLLLVAFAEHARVIGSGRPYEAIERPILFTIAALWLAALGTGAFAALSERELRRQKVDLERLSATLARIQAADGVDDIAAILLEELRSTFSLRSGVILASPTGALSVLASVGERELPRDTIRLDPVVARACEERRVVALRRFDPASEPGLAALLGPVRNVLVVPLLVERGRALGVLVLERGGTQRGVRRWIVAMLEQFASHGALALQNAWLADERDERMQEIEALKSMLEIHNAELEAIVEERTSELRAAISDLEDTDRQRRRLLEHVVTAGEEERKRIAADIHDDPVQKLVALKMRLELLQKQNPGIEDLVEAKGWVAVAIGSLRHLLFDLRPPVLDERGLAAALRALLENGDVPFRWTVEDDLDAQPSAQTRLILYRIAQEALTNARKHSEAEHVRVRLADEDGGVSMEISDDGVGFEPLAGVVAAPGHMGLAAIRERAEMAGGRCELHSLPGHGTTLDVWMPLEDAGRDVARAADDPAAFVVLSPASAPDPVR